MLIGSGDISGLSMAIGIAGAFGVGALGYLVARWWYAVLPLIALGLEMLLWENEAVYASLPEYGFWFPLWGSLVVATFLAVMGVILGKLSRLRRGQRDQFREAARSN